VQFIKVKISAIHSRSASGTTKLRNVFLLTFAKIISDDSSATNYPNAYGIPRLYMESASKPAVKNNRIKKFV